MNPLNNDVPKTGYGCWESLLVLLHTEKTASLGDLLKLTNIAEMIDKRGRLPIVRDRNESG